MRGRDIWISCDYESCDAEEFHADWGGTTWGELTKGAREAGWSIGKVNDFCPEHRHIAHQRMPKPERVALTGSGFLPAEQVRTVRW